MSDKTIVMLAGAKSVTNIIYHSLKNEFNIEKVIIEQPVSKSAFLKRRIKKLGFYKVFAQILFKLIIVPFLRFCSKKNLSALKQQYKFDDSPIDKNKVAIVESANSDETMRILKQTNPDAVVIEGTRIISVRLIDCIPAKFINMHVGITPLYRGVHGGYWALANNDREHCGVTVHLVDAGIDTGNILEQGLIEPTDNDNFVTYGLHQLAVGIPLLKKAIKNVLENRIEIKPLPQGKSKLWTHPTIWEYLWYRLYRKVK